MAKHLTKIEINCDMGEGFGRWKMGPDEELMDYIDAANIACGFHAGDPTIMLKTVRMAKEKGVKTGAHPGLQDLFGFGRRKIEMDPEDTYAMILYQVGSLKAILDSEHMPLSHIKPHGELYFYMQRDPVIMRAVLRACATFRVPVYACKNEMQKNMCAELGIEFVEEFYPDVDYTKTGELIPNARSKKPTVDDIYDRITSCAYTDSRLDNEGNKLKLGFDGQPFSVCLHSDMPGALDHAKSGRKAVNEINAQMYPK